MQDEWNEGGEHDSWSTSGQDTCKGSKASAGPGKQAGPGPLGRAREKQQQAEDHRQQKHKATRRVGQCPASVHYETWVAITTDSSVRPPHSRPLATSQPKPHHTHVAVPSLPTLAFPQALFRSPSRALASRRSLHRHPRSSVFPDHRLPPPQCLTFSKAKVLLSPLQYGSGQSARR